MKSRVCPVCDGKESNILRKINMSVPQEYHLPESYDVVTCKKCGLVYADTSAKEDDYNWYYSHCNFYGDDAKCDIIIRYERVKEFLERYLSQDSWILNIGSGNGHFEVALKQNGYVNISGTDPSKESVERLVEYGINAYVSNIYSEISTEKMGKYDCVCLFDVMEHLLYPKKGVQNIKRLLKKDGVFIISVPDYSKISEDRSHIPNYFNLEHINYFSETSLDNLMSQYGLKRIAQKKNGIDMVHVYKNQGVETGLYRDDYTEKAIKNYFENHDGEEKRIQEIIKNLKDNQREIVIWGTGSYVMSLIAQTELLNCNIKGFVDNNKIKQGREIFGYTIYNPDFLTDKRYLVIICSMLFGEEIKEQLELMNTKNEIILL